MNNFVHRGMPLGNEMGSDLESFDFGFKVANVMSDLFLDITYRFSQNGENNIIIIRMIPIIIFTRNYFQAERLKIPSQLF